MSAAYSVEVRLEPLRTGVREKKNTQPRPGKPRRTREWLAMTERSRGGPGAPKYWEVGYIGISLVADCKECSKTTLLVVLNRSPCRKLLDLPRQDLIELCMSLSIKMTLEPAQSQ